MLFTHLNECLINTARSELASDLSLRSVPPKRAFHHRAVQSAPRAQIFMPWIPSTIPKHDLSGTAVRTAAPARPPWHHPEYTAVKLGSPSYDSPRWRSCLGLKHHFMVLAKGFRHLVLAGEPSYFNGLGMSWKASGC